MKVVGLRDEAINSKRISQWMYIVQYIVVGLFWSFVFIKHFLRYFEKWLLNKEKFSSFDSTLLLKRSSFYLINYYIL